MTDKTGTTWHIIEANASWVLLESSNGLERQKFSLEELVRMAVVA